MSELRQVRGAFGRRLTPGEEHGEGRIAALKFPFFSRHPVAARALCAAIVVVGVAIAAVARHPEALPFALGIDLGAILSVGPCVSFDSRRLQKVAMGCAVVSAALLAVAAIAPAGPVCYVAAGLGFTAGGVALVHGVVGGGLS